MSFLQDKIFKLKGKIKHYDWGGYNFIPDWLGIKNDEKLPFAEYWMGAHHAASSEIETKNGDLSLLNLITDYPDELLGQQVNQKFGGLPYLFKIEDVRQMLSIQVHPTKEEAERGYEFEDQQGIGLNALQRNYKDRNHKPEIMVALSEFWLLHGFKQPDVLRQTLNDTPELRRLLPFFENDDYKNLYSHVMETSQKNVNYILLPLIEREQKRKQQIEIRKEEPGYWVCEFYGDKTKIKNADRGIFSLYFLNILKVAQGEAVFQDAGLLHAYLQGQAMELMANSDNVLRGGLTKKNINIPELLKQISFRPTDPAVIKPEKSASCALHYPCAASDFGIDKIQLQSKQAYKSKSQSLEIVAIMDGGLTIKSATSHTAKRGEVLLILPGTEYEILPEDSLLAFKAFVP